MFPVIWRGGVFLLFTLVVYLVCMQFVRVEEDKERARHHPHPNPTPRR